MTKSQDLICKRLRSLGYHKEQTHRVLKQITIWQESSGEEWTVKRLKDLKNWYVNLAAGTGCGKPEWLAYANSLPKGPFRSFFREGLNSLNPKRFWRALSALMVYTAYTSNAVTKSQADKFERAVTTPNPNARDSWNILEGIVGPRNLKKSFDELAMKVARNFIKCEFDHPERWMSRDKACPKLLPTDSRDRQVVSMTGVPHVKLQNALYDLVDAHAGMPIYGFEDITPRVPEALYTYLRQPYDHRVGHGREVVGSISVIQEPGYKGRIVANPHPLYQCLCSKLSNALWKTLRQIQEDGHMDQDRVRGEVQQYFASHPYEKLSSVDLSSATDRFPAQLQFDLLSRVRTFFTRWGRACKTPNEDAFWQEVILSFDIQVEILRQIFRGNYMLPKGLADKLGRKDIKWEVGQPMGAYPSFALFSLTHHAVLRSYQPMFYRILGDDLVVDAMTGLKHIQFLEKVGIPYAPEKSLMNSRLAEFAGYLITDRNQHPQLKVKCTSDVNFIAQAKAIGPKSLKLFRPRQRKVLKYLDSLIPDVYPQALGWNTKGIQYEERLKRSQLMAEMTAVREDLKISFDPRNLISGMKNRHFYPKPRLARGLYSLLDDSSLDARYDPDLMKLGITISDRGYNPMPEAVVASTRPDSLIREERKIRRAKGMSLGM